MNKLFDIRFRAFFVIENTFGSWGRFRSYDGMRLYDKVSIDSQIYFNVTIKNTNQLYEYEYEYKQEN